MASVLPNIEVGLHVDTQGQIKAIFPFERSANGTALPVGRELADYQGPIYGPGYALQPVAILEGLGLQRWKFDHLYPAHPAWKPWCWATWESPQIDFSGGHQQVREAFHQQHGKLLYGLGRKIRKLQKDHGAVEYRTGIVDDDLLELLLDWKSDQYERTSREHPFRETWVRQFLKLAMHQTHSDFEARLGLLVAGQSPVAIELSLRSHESSHMLICAHGSEFLRYSPGLLRNWQLMDSSQTESLRVVDFGKGLEEYKRIFANTAAIVAEGEVDRRQVLACIRSSWQRSRYRFLKSPISEPVKRLARISATRLPILRRLLAMK